MQIAVISDIHDRTDHLKMAFVHIRNLSCRAIICLGDIVSASTLNYLLELCSATPAIPIYIVWGNNDNTLVLNSIAFSHTIARLQGRSIMLDGLSIAMTHYPNTAAQLAKSQQYDMVFYGHTHKMDIKYEGKCLLANPGEIAGNKTGCVSFGLVDTHTRQCTFIRI